MLSQGGRPAKPDFEVGCSARHGRDAIKRQHRVGSSPKWRFVTVLPVPHRHIRHHGRFYVTLLIGAAVFLLSGRAAMPLRLAAAGDAFYGAYLIATLLHASHGTPGLLRKRATYDDEGMIVIVIITVAAIALSVITMFSLLNTTGPPDTLTLVLAILSVPLGWLTLHTVAAFHYGHLYYTRTGSDGRSDARGLSFPDTREPTSWDFLYFSFVIGMTAQVSDVQVRTTPLRRHVMAHGIVAFLYNTVLLALAVNIAVSLTH
jgi:uncharacterized membrane protein